MYLKIDAHVIQKIIYNAWNQRRSTELEFRLHYEVKK